MEFKEDLQLLPKSLGMIDLRLSLSKIQIHALRSSRPLEKPPWVI